MSIRVVWPDGKQSVLDNVQANQVLEVDYLSAKASPDNKVATPSYLKPVQNAPLFTHREREFDDYATEILLPHKMSQFGPHISTADVNADGLDDLYIGGAAGQSGKLFVQSAGGLRIQSGPWEKHAAAEDLGSVFFDADGDGDMDLYVVSGSNEFGEEADELSDRMYICLLYTSDAADE